MCPAKPWGEALDVGDGGRVTKVTCPRKQAHSQRQ